MATFSRVLLSGGTSGAPIPVAATATPGTLVHTAVAGATSFDEVYLWASNVTALAAVLTIEWGGVADPGSLITKALVIPPNSGPTIIVAGESINGGLAVRAFSATASAINITGHVNRIAA